jgi:signal transduction histidine kinase
MPSLTYQIVSDFQSLFESVPQLYLVLSPQKPYEIVAVSNAYLAATMTAREQLLGRGLWEAFPGGSEPLQPGMESAAASIEAVVRTGKADTMPAQKYDLAAWQAGRHGPEERYWRCVHSPIYSSEGTIRYVLRHLEDITKTVQLSRLRGEQQASSATLQMRAERAEAELSSSMSKIQKLTARLSAADALLLNQKNSPLPEQTSQLNRANHSLRQLTARLLQIRDEERRRIARDLHDSIGQMLAAQSMYLFSVAAEATHLSNAAAKALADSTTLIGQMSSELRTISYLLHPPLLDEAGLSSALRWYAEGFAERSKIKVSLALSPDLGRLSDEFEIAIFRIVQECLTNIHRHSESPTASISLAVSLEEILLEIKDQGKGMPRHVKSEVAADSIYGVGIRGMRERIMQLGGSVEISSSGQGTAVIARLPAAGQSSSAASTG